jgi:hypothetical protein
MFIRLGELIGILLFFYFIYLFIYLFFIFSPRSFIIEVEVLVALKLFLI